MKKTSSSRYKKALELFFAKKLNALDVELREVWITAKWFVIEAWVLMPSHTRCIERLQCTDSEKETRRMKCKKPYPLCYNCIVHSWADLARRLQNGAKIGKRFGFSLGYVFAPGDTLETVLVEFDLASLEKI